MPIAWQRLTDVAREGEGLLGAAGLGADGKPAAGAGQGQAQAVQVQGQAQGQAQVQGQVQGQAQGQAAEAYFPKGLDDKWKGKSERETLDNIAKYWAERPRAPETAAGYKLDLAPEVAKRFGDLNNDPAFAIMREVAHAAGVDNDLLGKLFVGTYAKLVDGGLMPKPIDWDAEAMKLAPAGERDRAAGIKAAGVRLTEIGSRIAGLESAKHLDSAEANALMRTINESAAGAVAVEKMLALLPKEHGVQAGGIQGGGQSAPADPMLARAQRMFPSHAQKHPQN
jgi:hypothetical protein